jgi:hypothetical protein
MHACENLPPRTHHVGSLGVCRSAVSDVANIAAWMTVRRTELARCQRCSLGIAGWCQKAVCDMPHELHVHSASCAEQPVPAVGCQCAVGIVWPSATTHVVMCFGAPVLCAARASSGRKFLVVSNSKPKHEPMHSHGHLPCEDCNR